MTYYAINETAARTAHDMNSSRTFQAGRVTAEYRQMVDSATALAQQRKAVVDAIHHDKIDGLLDAYARKLAAWYNSGFAIESRCPSVMITGASHFPVRKKEKQNQARGRHYEDYKAIEGLLEKIAAAGTGGISADDPAALDKLKEKLETLENRQAAMKAANAHYRKHKTMAGYGNLTAETAAALDEKIKGGYSWQQCPHPAYQLSNNNATIKQVKQRIADLERRAEKPPQGWEFDGGKVVTNAEENRLQILFDGKPAAEIRAKLKSRGFRWAPSQGAWQRQLTNNAIYAAKEVLK